MAGWQEGHPACKNWVAGCWHGYLSGVRSRVAYGPADATATLRLVSYFSKIQTGFTFLVPAHQGSPEKRPLNGRVCVCVVLCLCGISGIEAFLLAAQLRWVGHVVSMEDDRIPKEVFFGQLSSGKRQQCGPVRRYKDTVKTNMKSRRLPSWTGNGQLASSRSSTSPAQIGLFTHWRTHRWHNPSYLMVHSMCMCVVIWIQLRFSYCIV